MEALRSKMKMILRWRFVLVPPLILVLFIAVMVLCRAHSPKHYRVHRVFHISAFGNWQEGLGFFSGGLVIIGSLVYCFAEEVYDQRSRTKVCDNLCLSCRCPWIFKLGYLLIYLGFVITGCFQQSYNKPGHKIGLVFMAIGFIMMFVSDVSYFACKRKRKSSAVSQVVGICQVVLFAIVIISGIFFTVFDSKSKSKWNEGKERAWELKRANFNSSKFEECPFSREGLFNDWLRRDETDYSNYLYECTIDKAVIAGEPRSKVIYKISAQEVTNFAELSECPGRSINDWLEGKEYPYFYPCKSKSLWAPEDPGWTYYKMSAYSEITLFISLSFYTFTYLGHLEPREDPSYWIVNQLNTQ